MCGKNDEYINVSEGQVQHYIDGKIIITLLIHKEIL